MTTELRAAVANCPDETIIDVIRALVGGLIHGLAEELAGNADVITDRVVDAITEQLAAAVSDEPHPEPPPSPAAPRPVAERTAIARAAQDTTEHTCEICQRTGTRRFMQTATGWRCSPTATKCPGNHDTAAARQSGISAKPIQAEVTPPAAKTAPAVVQLDTPAPAPAPKTAPAYTARCQDCTRTWTLTGRVLRMAIDTHELKHAHIVNIVDGADHQEAHS